MILFLSALALAAIMFCSSCATVMGGKVTDVQRTKPLAGQAQRKIRAGYLVADIILCPVICLPVDFATGAIYVKEKKEGH